MKPAYQADGITIYHGDCRQILPTLGPIEAIVSDPPYGMSYAPLRGSDGSKRWADGVKGDFEDFDPAHLLGAWPTVLWGAQWYAARLPCSGG